LILLQDLCGVWLLPPTRFHSSPAKSLFPSLLFLSTIDSTGTSRRPHSLAKPHEGDARRLGGGMLRGCAVVTQAAVGEPALLLVDVAAALLQGCTAVRRTTEGAGAEVF